MLNFLTVVAEGFGNNTAGGSLFGNKPATGGLGTGLGTTFGTGKMFAFSINAVSVRQVITK